MLQCDSGKGAAVMYDLLYNKPQKVIMLAGCSAVCTTVAGAAQYWNLVTVCYGASSPALSNRYASRPMSCDVSPVNSDERLCESLERPTASDKEPTFTRHRERAVTAIHLHNL